jgi:hypothetical protein
MGKRVVIFSVFPYIAPLEAKIILSSSVSNLKKKIESAFNKTKIVYIGKKIQNGIIENYSISEIKNFFEELPGDHIFVEADSTKGRSISGYNRISISILQNTDRYINIVGADALNQQKNANWIAHQDEFWKKKKVIVPMDIGNWINSHPFFKKLQNRKISSTFYINKVENIYIENLAIPLAKNIKLTGVENVLIGSVFNSNLHLVK